MQWLAVKEGDDEKTIAKKRKLQKSYKSKMRFQNMDIHSKEKQNSWQSFLKGKGGKKKTGGYGLDADSFGIEAVGFFCRSDRIQVFCWSWMWEVATNESRTDGMVKD